MAEIRLDSRAFFHNAHYIRNFLPPKCDIAAVLKDNAYGHGLIEMAQLCKQAGIDQAFVKNSAEAMQIHSSFKEVSVLYGDIQSDAPINIHIAAHSLEQIAHIPKHRTVELKVDTGMLRNGIEPSELYDALELIRSRDLILRGVMTHNGYGDDFGSEFFTQRRRFEEVKRGVLGYVSNNNMPIPRFHSLSSSGILRSKGAIDDDCVRAGIALYGYECADSRVIDTVELQPVLSLWARKIATKKAKKGSRVGYSGASALKEEAYISTYDVGYGDGFPRLHEGHAFQSAEGAEILPRVSMDCMSVVSRCDEICVFNDVRAISKLCQTIPYEILVRLSPLLPRRIL